MKTHARVRRATSNTPGSIVKARVFLPSLRSTQFVIYVVDKGISCNSTKPHVRVPPLAAISNTLTLDR